MRRTAIVIACTAIAALLGGAASAAPLPKLGPVPDSGIQAEKVHGWHRYCAWGPARYHRHVPGIGNVPCGRGYYGPRAYLAPRVIVRPRPYYARRVIIVPRGGYWRGHRRWR